VTIQSSATRLFLRKLDKTEPTRTFTAFVSYPVESSSRFVVSAELRSATQPSLSKRCAPGNGSMETRLIGRSAASGREAGSPCVESISVGRRRTTQPSSETKTRNDPPHYSSRRHDQQVSPHLRTTSRFSAESVSSHSGGQALLQIGRWARQSGPLRQR
jgi:hypothetical protein